MKLYEYFKEYGITINDSSLIYQAFIHTSYINENKHLDLADNERLELLGDAVLQLWTADFLYRQEPKISEGDMTLLRAQLVNEKVLAEFSRKMNLGQFLKLGVGEEKNGGYQRNSILADTFEAVIGALYLDQGFEAISKICEIVIKEKFETIDKENLMDFKTKLQEFVQSDSRKTVQYHIISTSGPANQPVFEAIVKLDELILGKGKGTSKKRAEQQAAKDALNKLVK
ncbi:MAG TPA: ribonuclease III [Erysipelothrix sp.]|jgi:ribonuclease-3|nr:ribonuclease III [Erysipelothrix sp.]